MPNRRDFLKVAAAASVAPTLPLNEVKMKRVVFTSVKVTSHPEALIPEAWAIEALRQLNAAQIVVPVESSENS